MVDDAQLLRRFTEENSDAAFRELVQQRIDFVYAAALRQVGGDVHLAQEVTQSVFLDLARKARKLAGRPTVTGWLYTSTRFAAAKVLRSRARRLIYETEAYAMNEVLSANSASAVAWNELRPVLDAAMHELGETDREAILLRYFDGRSLAEVGATIGLAENSARMRVERALEKLRVRLARRGIISTTTALGIALANQPVISAPAGLAAAVAGASLSAGTAASAGVGTMAFFTKTNLVALTVAVVIGIGWYRIATSQPERKVAAEMRQPARMRPESRSAGGRQSGDLPRPNQMTTVAAHAAGSEGPAAMAGASTLSIEEQRRDILNNLRQIALARLMFIRSHNRAPNSLAELVGPEKFLREVTPVDGEEYGGLNLAQGGEFSVTTQSGLTVTHDITTTGSGTPLPNVGGARNAPAGLEVKVFKALDAWRTGKGVGNGPMPRSAQELLPYFATASDGADYVEWLEKIGWPQR